jgi:DNA-directed RNA polymerase specialized sigma24 family protein
VFTGMSSDARAAYDEFYRGTSRRTMRYAFGLTGDLGDAQDLTQEAYVRAWQRWSRLRDYESTEAWLRTVIYRLATDRWRHLAVRRLFTAKAPRVGYLDERLPAPCATTAHPSEAKLVARTSGKLLLHPGLDLDSTSTYGSTMSTYTAGGAGAYLAEVREALARCPSVRRARSVSDAVQVTVRYRQLSTGTLGGDESVLACRTYQTAAGEQEFLIAVERRGDRVLVVIDYGRDGVPSLPAEFNGFRDFDQNARFSDPAITVS